MLFEFIFQEPVTNFMVVHPVAEDILLKIKNVNVMVLLKGDSGDHQTHSCTTFTDDPLQSGPKWCDFISRQQIR